MRNLRWRPPNLSPVSSQWGTLSTWSWHIWPCLQQALSFFHCKLLQTVAAQRTTITASDIWLLECCMTWYLQRTWKEWVDIWHYRDKRWICTLAVIRKFLKNTNRTFNSGYNFQHIIYGLMKALELTLYLTAIHCPFFSSVNRGLRSQGGTTKPYTTTRKSERNCTSTWIS